MGKITYRLGSRRIAQFSQLKKQTNTKNKQTKKNFNLIGRSQPLLDKKRRNLLCSLNADLIDHTLN